MFVHFNFVSILDARDLRNVHQSFLFVPSANENDGDCYAYCWGCSRLMRMGQQANLSRHMAMHRGRISAQQMSPQDLGEYVHISQQQHGNLLRPQARHHTMQASVPQTQSHDQNKEFQPPPPPNREN